jgi:hypothetical protein
MVRSQVKPVTAVPASHRRTRVLTALAAVVAAAAVWVLAVPLFGLNLVGRSAPGSTDLQPIGLPAVVAASAIASLAAWVLLVLLERRSRRPARTWRIIAAVVLVVSYGGPLLGTGVPLGSRLTLAAMHTVVALILFMGLPRTASS